jgi:hypothetical protein
MEMYSPLKGKLRRTHHEGLFFSFTMTEQDYVVQAKIGHLQVCTKCDGDHEFGKFCCYNLKHLAVQKHNTINLRKFTTP